MVKANSFLFPLLIGGGERVAVINTINKGRDKTLLEVMDKDSSVSFFVIASLSDGGIETNEEILRRLRPLSHSLEAVLGGEAFIGIPERTFEMRAKILPCSPITSGYRTINKFVSPLLGPSSPHI